MGVILDPAANPHPTENQVADPEFFKSLRRSLA